MFKHKKEIKNHVKILFLVNNHKLHLKIKTFFFVIIKIKNINQKNDLN